MSDYDFKLTPEEEADVAARIARESDQGLALRVKHAVDVLTRTGA